MGKYAKMILEILNHSHEHLTAEQIYLRLKEENEKIVLASVYNNLNSLVEEGLIRRLLVEGKPDHYDRVNRHDHLVCSHCGKISDITLDDLTSSLSRQIGAPIESYDLRITWICQDCRKAMKGNEE